MQQGALTGQLGDLGSHPGSVTSSCVIWARCLPSLGLNSLSTT